jgi:integrase
MWVMNDAHLVRSPQKPKLLDRVRAAIRTRHYSRRTEEAYVHWIRRFIFYHGVRHPATSPSTQNQALSALLFLYREVLQQPLAWFDNIVPAKRPVRLPVVLSRDEVRAILRHLHGAPHLMATLVYGAGLRLLQCCRLRVKDVDFAANQIIVRPSPVT